MSGSLNSARNLLCYKYSIENFKDFFKINFEYILIKQQLSLLAVKFHTHSFFILGDVLSYIRPCSSFTMRGTVINLYTNWVICSFPKPNIFLSLDNNTSDLIEEKHKEHMIKLSRISFHPF